MQIVKYLNSPIFERLL